jgi:hypothetical protein
MVDQCFPNFLPDPHQFLKLINQGPERTRTCLPLHGLSVAQLGLETRLAVGGSKQGNKGAKCKETLLSQGLTSALDTALGSSQLSPDENSRVLLARRERSHLASMF